VAEPGSSGRGGAVEPPELRRLRRRIDALDRRLVRLMNERAELARDIGKVKTATGRRAIRDPQREREVLLRVSMANDGPTPQADLLAIFKRLFVVARSLERRDRTRERRAAPFGGVPEAGDERD
jgi:chorismate mutase